MIEGKHCKKCKAFRPLSEFYKHPKSKDRLQYNCRHCDKDRCLKWNQNNRERHQQTRMAWRRNNPRLFRGSELRKYWPSLSSLEAIQEYERIFQAQRGSCRICGISQSNLAKPLSVDHDSISGKVRGLLCQKCNLGLGLFAHTPEHLERAITYLKQERTA